MNKRVVVLDPNDFVLSTDAREFQAQPAFMPMVEDIYSIQGSDETAWIVVSTPPNQEARTTKKLAERSVEAFLPMERVYVKRTVVKTTMVAGMVQRLREKTLRRPVERPLMPGYLFARVPVYTDENAPRKLRVPVEATIRVIHTEGVTRVLSTDYGPYPIADKFVEDLRREQGLSRSNRTVAKPEWIKEGEKARVADGPFASFLATITECLPNDIVKAAVQMFGKDHLIEFELAQLEKP